MCFSYYTFKCKNIESCLLFVKRKIFFKAGHDSAKASLDCVLLQIATLFDKTGACRSDNYKLPSEEKRVVPIPLLL